MDRPEFDDTNRPDYLTAFKENIYNFTHNS